MAHFAIRGVLFKFTLTLRRSMDGSKLYTVGLTILIHITLFYARRLFGVSLRGLHHLLLLPPRLFSHLTVPFSFPLHLLYTLLDLGSITRVIQDDFVKFYVLTRIEVAEHYSCVSFEAGF